MDPKDFLRVATDLAKSDEAAELRSAVSRAYLLCSFSCRTQTPC